MKEKYIGKSSGLEGAAQGPQLTEKTKLELDINAPREIPAEEYNKTLLKNIAPEISRAKLIGKNLVVRFFLFTDKMTDAIYSKTASEGGTKMDAIRERPYQDYGVVVKRGEDCTLPKAVKEGTIVRVAPAVSGTKKFQYMLPTDAIEFDNYFLLNESLIMSYE